MSQSIPEITLSNLDEFKTHYLPLQQPVVIRGLVTHWPIVQAALNSAETFCRYLLQFDRGMDVHTAIGPASINGRIFYNADMSGLNCRYEQKKLASSLDYLLANQTQQPAPLLAMQSIPIAQYLPGLERENPLPLLPGVQPRIWIGGRATVAAHFDPSQNIACCIAGRRQFTLLPPEQVENLYVGPFEFTPSGTTISMVDFDAPDFARFPKFREAQAAALTAVLEPGDGIFIPYLWWHHVKALEPINALMNYWWDDADEQLGEPRNALLMAMMSLRQLPEPQRKAWQAMFNHYVFQGTDDSASYIPPPRLGILGKPSAELLRMLRQSLTRALSRL